MPGDGTTLATGGAGDGDDAVTTDDFTAMACRYGAVDGLLRDWLFEEPLPPLPA